MRFLLTIALCVAILAALDDGANLIGPVTANTDTTRVQAFRAFTEVKRATAVSLNTAATDGNIITVDISGHPFRFVGSKETKAGGVEVWTGSAGLNTSAYFSRDGEHFSGEIELGEYSFRVARFGELGVLAELKPRSERPIPDLSNDS